MLALTHYRNRFLDKNSGGIGEFLRYLPLSLATSFIDIGILIFLTEVLAVHYLVSAAIGFVVGQIWAYFVSVKWVFARRKIQRHAAGFPIFLILSITGLFLVEVLLWFWTEEAGIYYIYSRLIVSAAVSFLLFIARKYLLFS
ncbi:MAG TPA: GtrA family protein [Candidatus Paceibacterota bacterium]|jgi:putative flippase GtrA